MPGGIDDILEQLRISEPGESIFDMSYYKLRKHFSFAGGGLHTSRLIRNLIWQDHAAIEGGDLPQSHGNIRSYWYERCKPVLARAKARKFAKKYDMMIGQFVAMVVNHSLFSYSDFGFTDEGAHNRKLGGANRHVFCVAEKSGHMPLLQELADDYDVTHRCARWSALGAQQRVSDRRARRGGLCPGPADPAAHHRRLRSCRQLHRS